MRPTQGSTGGARAKRRGRRRPPKRARPGSSGSAESNIEGGTALTEEKAKKPAKPKIVTKPPDQVQNETDHFVRRVVFEVDPSYLIIIASRAQNGLFHFFFCFC